MEIHDLWSREDRLSLLGFDVAVRHGDLAGALLAVEGAPPDTSAHARVALQILGDRIRHIAGYADSATALSRVLVQQEGFLGDADDYYNPQNSFLSAVLQRRRGLPILLSAVWILAGEEAGMVVDGVALPGHFVVRVGGPTGVLVDPFAGGQMLSVHDCADIVRSLSGGEVPWNDNFLAPASLDGLLERVLRNLMNSFQRTAEPEGLFRTARFLAALRPQHVDLQLLQARMADLVGARDMAMELYGEVQDHFPGSTAADLAGTRLVELRHGGLEIN